MKLKCSLGSMCGDVSKTGSWKVITWGSKDFYIDRMLDVTTRYWRIRSRLAMKVYQVHIPVRALLCAFRANAFRSVMRCARSQSVLLLVWWYMIWYDMIWYIWYDMIYGMIWYDIWYDILTLRRLTSYIYGAPILDVSRSHTTTQHSR